MFTSLLCRMTCYGPVGFLSYSQRSPVHRFQRQTAVVAKRIGSHALTVGIHISGHRNKVGARGLVLVNETRVWIVFRASF